MRVLRTGIPAAGIAAGTAFVFKRRASAAPSAVTGDPTAEKARFHAALEQAKGELGILAAENDIFAAHLEMADDPMLSEQVEERISEHRFSAERALNEVCEEVSGMLAALDDERLSGRADDVRDVCGRIRRILTGETAENPFAGLATGTIVVAEELAPSDTALMDFNRIAGIVTARGSVTSHVCIIARAKGIAAIVGASECMLEIKTGDKLIINGETGEIIISPDAETERRYLSLTASRRQHGVHCLKGAHTPAVTRGGRRIAVLGNAGNVEEVRAALDAGAEGIGLFRSEFLYMQSRGGFPDEPTQFEAYRHAAELCGERPLIIRTLDIGGDKALPYMDFGHEENPFLGWRAIRISLSMHDMFRTQLRALLRASVFGNLRIMFPMITSVGEFRQAEAAVRECMAELDAEKAAYNPGIELGVMIETPAAVMVADLLAAETQFFSIGTNDLTQYVMAADRGNPRVAHLYDPSDTAVRRAVAMTLAAAHNAGIKAGMCGELAADPEATAWLLEAGLEEFSVSAPAVAPLKERIRTLGTD